MSDSTKPNGRKESTADNRVVDRALDIDYRSDVGRGPCRKPSRRRHEDYKQPRWATCHVESVDNLFAAATTGGSPMEHGAPQVRIDLDGVGDAGASLNEIGENINLSITIDDEQIDELIDQLRRARFDGEVRIWPDGGEEDADGGEA